MKTIYLKIVIILLLLHTNARAQTSDSIEQQIIDTIDLLFEGMNTSDSSIVASVFTRDAIMQTITVNEKGQHSVTDGSVQDFASSVSRADSGDLREELKDYYVRQDGTLASVWTPYAFYYKEQFSHCGVNSFQLVRMAEGWKIQYIIDTRRREGCEA